MPISKRSIQRKKKSVAKESKKPKKSSKREIESSESSSESSDEFSVPQKTQPIAENVEPKNEIKKQIRDRYQVIINDLWENEKKLEDFDFPKDLRNLLNARSRLWLEYFITNALFNSTDENLFKYMDSFTTTTKFL